MRIDYHNHTRLCKHASGDVIEYVEQAVEAGLSEIAFTDHMPLPDGYDSAHRMDMHQMETYLNWIQAARERFPQITILFGIEADFIDGSERYIEDFLNRFNFDLVIMSVHFIRHWPEGNWVFGYDFPDRSHRQILEDYFDAMQRGIETGLFDIVGHMDLIKQPGQSLIKTVPDRVSAIIDSIKKQKMCVEINSSGFRKIHRESFPGTEWFSLLKQYEIDLTTGSDSHAPLQVALNFDSVYKMLKKYNFNRIVAFRERKKHFIEID